MRVDSLAPVLETLAAAVALRPEVLEAYLFGSRARAEAQAHSDFDVAVYLDLEAVPKTRFGYAASLSAVLMTALGSNRVDLVALNEAPPLLYHRVLRDGVRFFARDLEGATGREGRALSRFCDWVPQLRKIDAAHSARIASGAFGR